MPIICILFLDLVYKNASLRKCIKMQVNQIFLSLSLFYQSLIFEKKSYFDIFYYFLFDLDQILYTVVPLDDLNCHFLLKKHVFYRQKVLLYSYSPCTNKYACMSSTVIDVSLLLSKYHLKMHGSIICLHLKQQEIALLIFCYFL